MKVSKLKKRLIILILTLLGIGSYIYFGFPRVRVPITDELVMLGDLNSDHKWNSEDGNLLSKFVEDPYSFPDSFVSKIDVNHSNTIDDEDLSILRHLYQKHDPYVAASSYPKEISVYPRAREFFKYFPKNEYLQRPVLNISKLLKTNSPFFYLKGILSKPSQGQYQAFLLREIFDEVVRFDFSYQKRKKTLTPIENNYLNQKVKNCEALFKEDRLFDLLLEVIGLTEDAETLSVVNSPPFIQKVLVFRDHLRGILLSENFKKFRGGKEEAEKIFQTIDQYLLDDLGLSIKLGTLTSPRNFLDIENYVERVKWQYYKTTTRKSDFEQLVLYAQYDHRYLRAVSKTSKKEEDTIVSNHNLPMILLFRKALQIKNGDKLATVGLLDEAIRIPFGWVRSIPRELLPSSIAMENFLLPGNKEDGLDKSRHWNVFGGISLYKSPEESLVIALAREIKDGKEKNYTHGVMREFLRDMIANINGIYYVMSMKER